MKSKIQSSLGLLIFVLIFSLFRLDVYAVTNSDNGKLPDKIGDVTSYTASSSVRTVTVEKSGIYKFEISGAGGQSARCSASWNLEGACGGVGAKCTVWLYLKRGDVVKMKVGLGKGIAGNTFTETKTGGWNVSSSGDDGTYQAGVFSFASSASSRGNSTELYVNDVKIVTAGGGSGAFVCCGAFDWDDSTHNNNSANSFRKYQANAAGSHWCWGSDHLVGGYAQSSCLDSDYQALGQLEKPRWTWGDGGGKMQTENAETRVWDDRKTGTFKEKEIETRSEYSYCLQASSSIDTVAASNAGILMGEYDSSTHKIIPKTSSGSMNSHINRTGGGRVHVGENLSREHILEANNDDLKSENGTIKVTGVFFQTVYYDSGDVTVPNPDSQPVEDNKYPNPLPTVSSVRTLKLYPNGVSSTWTYPVTFDANFSSGETDAWGNSKWGYLKTGLPDGNHWEYSLQKNRIFLGWFYRQGLPESSRWRVYGGNTTYGDDGVTVTDDDITLIGHWDNPTWDLPTPRRTEDVNFELNGGSLSGLTGNIVGEHSTIDIPFEGWWTAESGGTKINTPYKPAEGGNWSLYAHWGNFQITLPECTSDNRDFLGWFSQPQNGTATDKLLYYGKAGDVVQLDRTTTFYAWFNKRPMFVDIYEGMFFEGQEITYNELLELIGDFDYEDNYTEYQTRVVDGYFSDLLIKYDNAITDVDEKIHLIEEDDVNIYIDAWLLSLDEGVEVTEEDVEAKKAEFYDNQIMALEEQKKLKEVLLEEKSRIGEARIEALNGIEMRLLQPTISEIKYLAPHSVGSADYRTTGTGGVHQIVSSTGVLDVADIKRTDAYNSALYDTMYLDTRSANIGYVDITYQVHDEGIKLSDVFYKYDMSATDFVGAEISLDANGAIPNSEITMEYTRRCQINFNYNPLISVQNTMYYNETDFGSDIASEMIKRQAVLDSEDTQDFIPWWSIGDDKMLLNNLRQNTLPNLQDTLTITGVTEFKFDSAFQYQFAEACQKFLSEYDSPEGNPNKGVLKDVLYDKSGLLNEVYLFRNNNTAYWTGKDVYGYDVVVTKGQMWDGLTSIRITYDAHDQWGKYASNKVTDDKKAKGVDTSKEPDGYEPPFIPEDPDNPDDPDKPYDPDIYQTEPERSGYLILINKDLDIDMVQSRIQSYIRYVSSDWIKNGLNAIDMYELQFATKDTLGDSWWGLSGRKELENALNTGSLSVKSSYSGNSGDLRINVNDYTN